MPVLTKTRRRSRAEVVHHVIEIRDWNFDYLFGIDQAKVGHLPYWDSRALIVQGTILQPALKAPEATVRLSPSNALVGRELKSTQEAKPVGYISYRGNDYSAGLFMPSDAFNMVLQMFIADKYRFVIIDGEKCGSGEVNVHLFRFSKTIGDE
jgi:hypothetical protein